MGHRLCVLMVLVITLLMAANAVPATGGRDLTQAYAEANVDDCTLSAAHINVLRQHQVLLVPGYFSNLDPAYFADHLRWLSSIGVSREKVAIEPGQSIEVNAKIVAAAIRKSQHPVILVTHSKGSVDALEALRIEPSLRGKVHGWISLQGAFFGSPVADMLLDGSTLDPLIAIAVLGFIGGTMESAQGLTTSASRAYYLNHKTAIDTIVREVPAVAFASTINEMNNKRIKTQLEIPHDLMRRKGIRSDGLVPVDAAVLPGMNFVTVPGVDHIAPVMPAATQFDRVRMIKTLLLLTLESRFRKLPRDTVCTFKR